MSFSGSALQYIWDKTDYYIQQSCYIPTTISPDPVRNDVMRCWLAGSKPVPSVFHVSCAACFVIVFLSFDSLGLAVFSVVCGSVCASASISVASPGSPQATCRLQVTARQGCANTGIIRIVT